MAKNIVVLSDGTGNSASKVWRTNVWRVFESLDLSRDDQIASYDDGVGSSSFKPVAMLGGVFGWGLKRNVLDLYTFICRNYKSGDQIYAFGFSRGAYTIRVLLGLLLHQGIVQFSSEAELQFNARQAYRAYRADRYHTFFGHEVLFRALRDAFLFAKNWATGGIPYNKTNNIQIPSIRFVGVWDTVAAYGLPIEEMTRGVSFFLWPLELPDRKLHPNVSRACHALAIDDERTTFHPVLWTEKGEATPRRRKDGSWLLEEERLSQVWFCGMHSNVGGGYPDDSLAYIPLHWIMQEAIKCGLHFKSKPEAEPDAMLRVASGLDVDGRLYDSRAGIGGYYRYGPRKIADLSKMGISRNQSDAVDIASPKIHETLLKRMQAGTQGYVVFGLPEKYSVAMCDGTVVNGKCNPFESVSAARARSQLQERVWNYVWWRRVVYFLTIAVSFHLALFPLIHQTIDATEFTSSIRWISELVRIVGAFLPWFAGWWLDAFASSPWWFVFGVSLLALMISAGVWLGGRIDDSMRAIVSRDRKNDNKNLLPSDWLFKVRTSTPYLGTLRLAKRYVIPALSAAVVLYLAVGLVGHFAFHVQDSAGVFCKGHNGPPILLPNETAEVTFKNDALCWPTGWSLVEGNRYHLHIKKEGPWRDGTFNTDIGGYEIAKLPEFSSRVKMFALTPLRRVFLRPWFRIIVRIGERGTDEYFVDPEKVGKLPDDEISVVFTARRDGELFLYVNEAVVSLSWWADIFYRDNVGAVPVRLTRLPN